MISFSKSPPYLLATALLSAIAASAWAQPAPSTGETIRYRFDHPRQTMQGWQVISGQAKIETRGLGVPKLKGQPHQTMLVRSPMFRLNSNPLISISLRHGKGGKIPLSPSQLEPKTTEGGPMGVALRRVTDDAWVATGQLSQDNKSEQISFPKKSLLALREAAPDEVYTLDFFDAAHGKPGHVQMTMAELNATPVELKSTVPDGYEHSRPLFLGAMHGKLAFDKTNLYATPGSKVSLTLFNTDEMAHNWVLCKPDPKVADELGKYVMENITAMIEAEFIPKDPRILYHSRLVAPGTSDTQYFTVPTEEGAYPFVCTFPGHHHLMRGILHIVDEIPLPETNEIKQAESVDPFLISATDRPVVIRGPISGGVNAPAAVCVGMPGGASFSFDTATCEISNVWLADKKGFINTTGAWGGRGGKALKILGKVKHKNSAKPKPGEKRFRSYTINADGLPIFEFESSQNTSVISLRVELAKDGKTLLIIHESSNPKENRTEIISLGN